MDVIIAVVSLIKKYPYLYDKNHVHHKPDAVELAWAYVAYECKFKVTIRYCKNMFKDLLATYMRARKVVSQKGTCNWPCYELMVFFEPYVDYLCETYVTDNNSQMLPLRTSATRFSKDSSSSGDFTILYNDNDNPNVPYYTDYDAVTEEDYYGMDVPENVVSYFPDGDDDNMSNSPQTADEVMEQEESDKDSNQVIYYIVTSDEEDSYFNEEDMRTESQDDICENSPSENLRNPSTSSNSENERSESTQSEKPKYDHPQNEETSDNQLSQYFDTDDNGTDSINGNESYYMINNVSTDNEPLDVDEYESIKNAEFKWANIVNQEDNETRESGYEVSMLDNLNIRSQNKISSGNQNLTQNKALHLPLQKELRENTNQVRYVTTNHNVIEDGSNSAIQSMDDDIESDTPKCFIDTSYAPESVIDISDAPESVIDISDAPECVIDISDDSQDLSQDGIFTCPNSPSTSNVSQNLIEPNIEINNGSNIIEVYVSMNENADLTSDNIIEQVDIKATPDIPVYKNTENETNNNIAQKVVPGISVLKSYMKRKSTGFSYESNDEVPLKSRTPEIRTDNQNQSDNRSDKQRSKPSFFKSRGKPRNVTDEKPEPTTSAPKRRATVTLTSATTTSQGVHNKGNVSIDLIDGEVYFVEFK